MAAKTDAMPALFSTEWWATRHAVMADIGESQSRLRRDYKIPADDDPVRARLERERSDAAMAVALYGVHTPNTEDRAYARAWDAAVRRFEEHVGRGRAAP